MSSDERAAMDQLARAMAAALADSAVRQEVKAALAGSAVRESKLHFNSFIEGRGGEIVAAANRAGRGLGFAAASGKVRALEFYMPVAAQRARWTGDRDVIVAYMLGDDEPIIGYRSDGARMVLDRMHPPETPVLSLVPVETNFSDQIPLNEAGRQPSACGVSATETLAVAADRCGVFSRSSMALMAGQVVLGHTISAPPLSREVYGPITENGLYMTFMRVMDAKEYWIEGDPELEIHITGRKSPAPLPAGDFQCIGQLANDAGTAQPGIRSQSYVYDQNGNFWSGQVLLLNQVQIDSLQRYSDGVTISVWEDDNEACVVHPHLDHTFADYIDVVGGVVRGVTAVRAAHGVDGIYQVVAGTAREVLNFVGNQDDPVGVVVAKDSTPMAGQYADNTHMVYDGTTFNGRATLVWKTTGQAPPATGPITAVEVNPINDTVGIGLTRQFQAVPYDAQGRIVDGASISWSTANGSVASVGSDGYVVGNSAGQTTITASANGITNGVAVNVRPVPQPPSVSISDPTQIQPGATCTWQAYVSGGTAPYSYHWTIDGLDGGTGYSATGSKSAGTTNSYFTVSVSVTDGAGMSNGSDITVVESSSAHACQT